MTHTELASLLLSLMIAAPELDGSLAGELAAACGVTTTELRPALRTLVRDGILVTSGRTRGTRYSIVREVETMIEVASMMLGVLVDAWACRGSWTPDNGDGSGSLRMEEISAIIDAPMLRQAMAHLVSSGIVRRTGNTRSARYTAVAGAR